VVSSLSCATMRSPASRPLSGIRLRARLSEDGLTCALEAGGGGRNSDRLRRAVETPGDRWIQYPPGITPPYWGPTDAGKWDLSVPSLDLPLHPSVQPAGAGFARQVPWFRKGGRTRRYKIKRSETCQMGVQFVSVRSPNGNPGLRKPGREM
jgi:hypothetical protein